MALCVNRLDPVGMRVALSERPCDTSHQKCVTAEFICHMQLPGHSITSTLMAALLQAHPWPLYYKHTHDHSITSTPMAALLQAHPWPLYYKHTHGRSITSTPMAAPLKTHSVESTSLSSGRRTLLKSHNTRPLRGSAHLSSHGVVPQSPELGVQPCCGVIVPRVEDTVVLGHHLSIRINVALRGERRRKTFLVMQCSHPHTQHTHTYIHTHREE